MKEKRPYRINGNSALVSEGIAALEALGEALSNDEDADLATLTISENDQIVAVVSTEFTHDRWEWDGQAWVLTGTD